MRNGRDIEFFHCVFLTHLKIVDRILCLFRPGLVLVSLSVTLNFFFRNFSASATTHFRKSFSFQILTVHIQTSCVNTKKSGRSNLPAALNMGKKVSLLTFKFNASLNETSKVFSCKKTL
jgi:hypothetical protein